MHEPPFFLAARTEDPPVPDFDGQGPRACSIADRCTSIEGREYWLVDIDPPIAAHRQVILVSRHREAGLDDVFDGRLVYVHVALTVDWDAFRASDAPAESDYWGEIAIHPEDLPPITKR
jgi:hypothetical protein